MIIQRIGQSEKSETLFRQGFGGQVGTSDLSDFRFPIGLHTQNLTSKITNKTQP
jgi:hypothetical protein